MTRMQHLVRRLLVMGLLLAWVIPASAYAAPIAANSLLPAVPPTPSPLPAASATPEPLLPPAMADRSEQLHRLLTDLRTENDPARVDLDELGFALGGDAETIVDWVRHNIRFQQYPGVLHGAFGTLITRSGNAPDQALLLARLLGDAGYEIRIVRGHLRADQAAELMRQIAIPRDLPPTPDRAALDDTIAQIGALHGGGRPARRSTSRT